MGLISRDEVTRLTAQFTKECREELIRRGRFSKGFRVPASDLRSCVKSKWIAYKKQIALGQAGG